MVTELRNDRHMAALLILNTLTSSTPLLVNLAPSSARALEEVPQYINHNWYEILVTSNGNILSDEENKITRQNGGRRHEA